MPTTYAHYAFGKEVTAALGEKERCIINNNIDMFNLGIYGPDFLFFYKPVTRNRYVKLCSRHHHQPSSVLLRYASDRIKAMNKKDAYMAYMYGFMCHFALDSYCHGYINKTSSDKGIRHNLQETEFDRMLMERDGFDPVTYRPTEHIRITKEYAGQIADIYPDVDERIVYKSFKTMKRLCSFLVAPSHITRFFIYAALIISGRYEKKKGAIIRRQPVACCEETNKEIYRLYNKAVKPAVILICGYEDYIAGRCAMNPMCNYTFSPQPFS